jgi:hypothetical protein
LIGSRTYELSNHLGKVLATISDKKVGNDSSGTVNYYTAEVLTQTDYYPFGMKMPGRSFDYAVAPPPAPPAGGGTPSSPVKLNEHPFSTSTPYPYTTAPSTLSSYLSNSTWTNTQGSWTSITASNNPAISIYLDNFNTISSNHPYTVAPATLSSYLSTSGWTNSQGAWTSTIGVSGNALTISSSTPLTTTLTMSLSVQSGYKVCKLWLQRQGRGR